MNLDAVKHRTWGFVLLAALSPSLGGCGLVYDQWQGMTQSIAEAQEAQRERREARLAQEREKEEYYRRNPWARPPTVVQQASREPQARPASGRVRTGAVIDFGSIGPDGRQDFKIKQKEYRTR